MKLTAADLVQMLGGTNSAARFFGVKPPSVSDWLARGAVPEGRLVNFAARLEQREGSRFSRREQWPDTWQEKWPELADANAAEVQPGEGAHA